MKTKTKLTLRTLPRRLFLRVLKLSKTHTVPEIVRKTGLSDGMVRRLLKAARMQAKPGYHAPLDGVDIEGEIKRLGSVAAVAAYYGVSRQAVYSRR